MLKKNKLRLGVATAAAVCAVAMAVSASPAFADPTGFKTLSGVGSDTIQDVMNGMGSSIPAIGSYDAVNPATQLAGGTITTKAGGNPFLRPNGSGQGVQALSDSTVAGHLFNGVDITGQVDFARSSGGPSASGTDLTYIPFALDAVSYAVNAGSDFPRNIPLGGSSDAHSRLSLYNIYNCFKTTYLDSNLATVTIHPLLPQSNSGTAKFWAQTMGYTDTTVPSCVKRVNTDSTPANIEEHNGTTIDDAGDIVPFSIAQYIAQGNHASLAQAFGVTINERRGNIALGSIGGQPAIREVGTTTVMNPDFPVTRSVFNVVPTTSTTVAGPIKDTFVGASSAVCSQSALIQSFGFQTLSNCGSVALTGPYSF